MDYQLSKLLHLSSIIFSLFLLFGANYGNHLARKVKNLLVIASSLMIIVSGIFLMKHIGINLFDTLPFWLRIKTILWVLTFPFSVFLAKKLAGHFFRPYLSVIYLFFILFAVVLSIYHPTNLMKLKNELLISLLPFNYQKRESLRLLK